MASLITPNVLQYSNFEFRYSPEDFLNTDGLSASNFADSRMNRAWVIHNAGFVRAIVFADYYAYCEQDALDEACDRGKLDGLLVSESELADYQVGTDSDGNPEYEGLIHLGNASEPFASESLDIFCVPASVFATDEHIRAVIAKNDTEEYGYACEDCVQAIANDDYSGLDYHYSPEESEQRMKDIRAGIEAAGGYLVIGEDEGFKHAGCDVCGLGLAGNKHTVNIIRK